MNYSAVVSKAWQYVWKHKILWLFALFAGSIIGGGMGTSSWSMGGSRGNNQESFWKRMPGSHPWFNQMETWFNSIPKETWIWLGIAAFALMLFFCILGLFVGTAGRAGLIKGLLMAEDRPNGSRLSFKEVWKGMKPYFWRLLLLRLFIGIASFVIGIAIVLSVLFLTVISLGTILLLLIPLAILIVPFNWLVQSLIIHATIALVDEDLDIFKAIKRGFEVVIRNIWPMLVTMLIVVLISFATGMGSLILIGLTSLPWIITVASGHMISAVGWAVGGIAIGLTVLLVCFVGTWVNTLVHGIFVVTFRQFKAKETANVPTFTVPLTPIEPIAPIQPLNEEPFVGTQNPPAA